SCFLGSATFSVSDLLRAKDERLTLSLNLPDVCYMCSKAKSSGW
ncbi:unnamed protein product, partial [Tetraodon nigroviridis]